MALSENESISVSVAPTVSSIMVQELADNTRVRLSWSTPSIKDLRGQLMEYRVEVREKSAADHVDEIRPPVIVPLTSNDYVVDGKCCIFLWFSI